MNKSSPTPSRKLPTAISCIGIVSSISFISAIIPYLSSSAWSVLVPGGKTLESGPAQLVAGTNDTFCLTRFLLVLLAYLSFDLMVFFINGISELSE
jgi:hypothetical protein